MSDIDSKINIDYTDTDFNNSFSKNIDSNIKFTNSTNSNIRSLPTNNNKNSKLSKSRFGLGSNSGLASGSNFNFNFLFKLSKTLKVLLGFSFVLIALAGTYLINNQDFRTAFASGNDPIISIAIEQKSGSAPFDTGTCTTGGTSYTPGQDVCDTDNVVRTLDTVEFKWTVSVTSDPANNVTVVQTLPAQMVWNSGTLPVFCRTGAGISPQSSYSGQTLTCNLGSFTAGTSTTTNYGQIFAKVKGDNPNGTNISIPAITANADSNIVAGTKIANSTSNTLSPLVVSASPRYDVFLANNTDGSTLESVLSPSGEEGILTSGIAVSIKYVGIKGVEMIQQPFTADVSLEYLSTPASGQTFEGARFYNWGGASKLGCTGGISFPGFLDGPNVSCTQVSGPGSAVRVNFNSLDLSGTNTPKIMYANTLNAPDLTVISQKVRFWIPKADFDKISGTNFQWRARATNFVPATGSLNPVSISGTQNNGTGIESNTTNNIGATSFLPYNPANPVLASIGSSSSANFALLQNLVLSGGYAAIGEATGISVFIGQPVNSYFTTINNFSICAALDTTLASLRGPIVGSPGFLPVADQTDFSSAIYEYAAIPNYSSANSCDDSDGTWVSYADIGTIGGLDAITRVRARNVNNLKPFLPASANARLAIPVKIKDTLAPNTGYVLQKSFTKFGSGSWVAGGNGGYTYVNLIPRASKVILADGTNNNANTVLLNNPAGGSNTIKYALQFGSASALTDPSKIHTLTVRERLPAGQTYLVGSGLLGTTATEPASIVSNVDGTQDLTWIFPDIPFNTPTRTVTYKTIVSAFTPTGRSIINQTVATSPEFFDGAIRPFYTSYADFNAFNSAFTSGGSCSNSSICGSTSITVQNLSSFAVEQVPNNPLIEKNKDLGFTLRYGNLDTLNPVASSTHINVFPFSSQTPPRSPATNFTGNLSFKGLVVAPNSNSSDPAVLNTNDNITGGAGTVQYTKAVSSSIASDPCDPSNNPSSSPVNTNPRCAGVDASVIGTGTTIWCTAALNPSTPTIKQYTVLGTTGTVGANSSTCPTTLSEVTGVRFTTGTLPVVSGTTGAVIYEIGLNFSTSGNTNNNIYTNLSQARAAGIATVATSNSAVTRVTTGSISGNIFNDKDSNGIKDVLTPIPNPAFNSALPADPVTNPATIPNPANDFNLSNVTVELRHGTGNLDSSGAVIAANTLIETKTTDSTGNYTFTNVSSGNYTVVVLQNGIPLSRQTTDKDFAANLAANPTTPNLSLLDNKTAVTLNFVAGTGVTSSSDVNFGYNQYSRITGKIYADTNNNGTQDGSEPDFNATTNPIPTGTSVVITSTSNPSITYTLTTATSSTVVSGFTTGSISTATTPSGSFGTFSQDLPVGEYTVTVATTNPKYAVSTSTQLGDSLGANPSTLTLSFGETKSSGSDGLYLVQIQNSDIQSIVCTPTSTNVNTTTDCTVTLVNTKNFNNLSGSIDFRIGDGTGAGTGSGSGSGNTGGTGAVKTCTIPTTGLGGTGSDGTLNVAKTTLTCNAIGVGANIGIFPAQFKASGVPGGSGANGGFITGPSGSTPSNITVNNPIATSDIDKVVCVSPKSINQPTDCVVTLTAASVSSNRAFNNLTGSISLKISNGALLICPSFSTSSPTAGTGTPAIPAFSTLNCNGVNVGSIPSTNTGFTVQYVLSSGSSGSGTTTTLSDAPNTPSKSNYVVVTNAIANSDIDSVVCSPTTTSVNTTVNCIVTLISGKTFNTLTGDIKLQISNGAIATCPNFTTSISPFNTLTCTAIPVGTLIGTFKARYSAANETAIDTKSNSITVINDLVRNDLASIAVTCIPAVVNFITTCTFTLPTNKTLPVSPNDLKLGIGNGATSGSCRVSTVDNRTVTCINVPTGSVGGTQPIRGQIGNGIPGDLSGNSAITDLSGVVEIGFVTSDVLFIPDSAITLTPNPVTTGLSIFGATDYTIVVKDDRMVTTPGSSLNSSAAVCTYRVKELSSQPNDANRGYTKLTSTIISPYNNGGTYNANSTVTNLPTNTNTNTTPTPTPQYEVNYNTGTGTTTGTTNNNTTGGTTNLGTSIKITKENQKFVDYNLEIRCKRTSDGQLFGRDERINFLFGAYSIVTVTGVVVV